jgi:hypothetical protein
MIIINNTRIIANVLWMKDSIRREAREIITIKDKALNLVNLRGTGSYEIDCDTLDNIIGGHKVDVMKMDIEGSEVPALASNTLKRLRKVIVEVHTRDDLQRVEKVLKDKIKLELDIVAGLLKHIIGSKY